MANGWGVGIVRAPGRVLFHRGGDVEGWTTKVVRVNGRAGRAIPSPHRRSTAPAGARQDGPSDHTQLAPRTPLDRGFRPSSVGIFPEKKSKNLTCTSCVNAG